MNCPYCGGFNADDRKVCRFCEAPLPKEPEVPKVIVIDGPRAGKKVQGPATDIVNEIAPFTPPPAEYSGFGADPAEEYITDNAKSRSIAVVLCVISLVTGFGGLQRLYLGYTVLGIIHFFTLGIFRVGTIVDLVLILTGRLNDKNGVPLTK